MKSLGAHLPKTSLSTIAFRSGGETERGSKNADIAQKLQGGTTEGGGGARGWRARLRQTERPSIDLWLRPLRVARCPRAESAGRRSPQRWAALA